jgi:hypothetical protein
MGFLVFDATNNQIIVEPESNTFLASNTTKNYQVVFTIPDNCAVIRIGAKVLVENIGAVLSFDLMSISDRPFVYDGMTATQSIKFQGSVNEGSSNTRIAFLPTVDENVYDEEIIRITSASTTGTEFEVLADCIVHASMSLNDAGSTIGYGWSYNISGADFTTSAVSLDSDKVLNYANGVSGTARGSTASFSRKMSRGDKFYPHLSDVIVTPSTRNTVTIVAVKQVESIVTPTTSMLPIRYVTNSGQSIDGAVLTVTIVDFEDKVLDAESQVTTGASWKFTAKKPGHYKVRGYVTYATASFAGSTQILSYIYKNGSQYSRNTYLTPSTTMTISPIAEIEDVVYLAQGEYIDFRTAQNSGSSKSIINDSTFNRIIIEKIDGNALMALPVDRVAYFSEVQSSGTNGGSFNSGSYITRTLNTHTGSTDFASLSSNTITLTSGTYDIEFSAPAYDCSLHKARFYNVTSSSVAIQGSSEIAFNASAAQTRSTGMGRITVSASTQFRLEHRCSSTQATDGLGYASSFGDNEVYSWVKINKVK